MSKPRRIYSIDIFRGMTIVLMIIVNNPGSWAYVYAPLRHAKWHGCTLTDLVFPFFLFIVGAAMRFAFVRWHSFASNEFYSIKEWNKLLYDEGFTDIKIRDITIKVINVLPL